MNDTKHEISAECDCPECVLEQRNLLRIKLAVLTGTLKNIVNRARTYEDMDECPTRALEQIGDEGWDALSAIGINV